ncbi:hypothetical protein GsuE55_17120 [Geobacillus subterraneus]|uniref:Uncharacterized protein n=1 Tax=Geobacillus subterraneus TaxID=129338 RepID=A0A679FPG8_9BACL|nr:hypothetical protein GsuE55_17120 [Geobacillus subterraneus]
MYEKQYPNEGAVLFNQPEEKSSYGPIAEQVLNEAIFQFQQKKINGANRRGARRRQQAAVFAAFRPIQ